MRKEILLVCRKVHKTVVSVGEIKPKVNGAMLWSSGERTVRSGCVHGNIGEIGGEWFVLAGRYELGSGYMERLVLLDGFMLDPGSGVRYTL